MQCCHIKMNLFSCSDIRNENTQQGKGISPYKARYQTLAVWHVFAVPSSFTVCNLQLCNFVQHLYQLATPVTTIATFDSKDSITFLMHDRLLISNTVCTIYSSSTYIIYHQLQSSELSTESYIVLSYLQSDLEECS